METDWITENIVEIFGAVTGIAYVILEIRRNILLWPLGIITSAVYIYVFGHNGFYANMGLQGYYLGISFYGWFLWRRAQGAQVAKRRSPEKREGTKLMEKGPEPGAGVIRIERKTAIVCVVAILVIWGLLWFVLDRWTDSPVPLWDGLITSLSVVATWMLTRKILEQWYVWIVANAIAVVVYLAMGMYPTAVLFMVYFGMAIVGVREWSRQSPVDSRQSPVSSRQ